MTRRRIAPALLCVALGIGLAVTWCSARGRSGSASHVEDRGFPTERSPVAEAPAELAPTDARLRASPLPARRNLSGPPPLELAFRDHTGGPFDDDPQHQKIRREIYEGLLSFRDEAALTPEQWKWFLAELQETAVSFGYLINDQGFNRITFDDWNEASVDLARDLEERLAQHLTEQQMRVLRFRYRLRYLPAQIARGNILQDPDDPDRKAWTIPNDVVLPNDVPLPPAQPGQNL